MLEKLGGLLKNNCECCGNLIADGHKITSGGVTVCTRCSSILTKYGLEPKDIKVFDRNQLNVLTAPNVSAVRKLQEFKVTNPPLPLVTEESCYYVGNAQGGKVTNKVVGYTGGSKGVSVRVMKGLSYRVGASSAQPVRQDVLNKSNVGVFIITGNRMILQTDRYGFELKNQNIQTINLHGDAIEIFTKGKQYLVLTHDTRYITKVLELISEASREEKAFEEKAEQRKKSAKKAGITVDTVTDNETNNQKTSRRSSKLSSDDSTIIQKLKDYKKLLDDGILTEEEFNQIKKNLLGL